MWKAPANQLRAACWDGPRARGLPARPGQRAHQRRGLFTVPRFSRSAAGQCRQVIVQPFESIEALLPLRSHVRTEVEPATADA